MDQSHQPNSTSSDNDGTSESVRKLREFIDRSIGLRQLAKKAHLADMVKQKSAADKQHNKDCDV